LLQNNSSFISGTWHECSLARAPAGWDRRQLLLEQIRSATAMPIRPVEHQLRISNDGIRNLCESGKSVDDPSALC
jgi:hypothetical protein